MGMYLVVVCGNKVFAGGVWVLGIWLWFAGIWYLVWCVGTRSSGVGTASRGNHFFVRRSEK